MKFKGAIFDLDGTMLDSMGVWKQIDIDFLAKRGLYVPEDYVEAITPLSFRDAAKYTIERFGLTESPEEIMDEWHDMSIESYSGSVLLKPFVKQYLLKLKDLGIKLAVATAAHERLFIPALKNNGIHHLFDAFTTLNEVDRGKGFPDIYLRAAEKIGLLPEECVVFEDIYIGIKGAKAGGFFAVGVYDSHSGHERDKIIELSDVYINGFAEIIDERDPIFG